MGTQTRSVSTQVDIRLIVQFVREWPREAALAAMNCALEIGNKALDELSASFYENEAVWCIWNDWQARDQQARIQRTYANGRYSREKRVFGVVSGRWYCCYKQAACKALGHTRLI